MKKFRVKSVQKESWLYWYDVEAKNLKEAREKLESGDGEYIDSEMLESEILSIEKA